MKLSRESAEKIIAVIERDCFTRFTYRDRDGNTCAIGALAIAAEVGYLLPPPQKHAAPVRALDDLSYALQAAYGVDEEVLTMIQWNNDDCSTPEERRSRIRHTLLAYVQSE